MDVDNFISWETKLDLGYRNMGEAYSYGVESRGATSLIDSVAITGNYSLARGLPETHSDRRRCQRRRRSGSTAR